MPVPDLTTATDRRPASPFTPFAWDDALRLESALSEDERAIRDAAHAFCQEKLFPRVLMANRLEKFDREIMNEFGEMGFLGATLEGYGCAGVNYVSYGLISREVERVDSGYRSRVFCPVVVGDVSDLRLRVGGAAAEIPAEAAHWRVRRLLRPDRTRCRVRSGVDADACEKGRWRFLLNGSKTWITNSPIADVLVVWAKDDAGDIRGFILERGMPGLTQPKIEGKFSLRASVTGMIMMQDVFVPAENRCPG